MSTHGNLFALALGVGGGALAWHLTRRTFSTSPAAGAPPRTDGPCSLMLDASGITADGAAVSVPAAVARCKPIGRAELVVAGNAPASALAQLTAALHGAGVSFTQKVA